MTGKQILLIVVCAIIAAVLVTVIMHFMGLEGSTMTAGGAAGGVAGAIAGGFAGKAKTA